MSTVTAKMLVGFLFYDEGRRTARVGVAVATGEEDKLGGGRSQGSTASDGDLGALRVELLGFQLSLAHHTDDQMDLQQEASATQSSRI